MRLTTYIPLTSTMTLVGNKLGQFKLIEVCSNWSKKINIFDYVLRIVELTDVVILLTWTGSSTYAAINTVCCGVVLAHDAIKAFQWDHNPIHAIKSSKTSSILDTTEFIGILLGYTHEDWYFH